MPYASGEIPVVGDRIMDTNSRAGTIMSCNARIFTVNWDEGGTGIYYTVAERFSLISRTIGNALKSA